MLNPDQRHHPLAALARHDEAALAENLLDGEQSRGEIHNAPSRRGFGLQERRRLGRPVRQREAVAVGMLAHHQFDRVRNELQTLVAAPAVEHEGMFDQRQKGVVVVEFETLLTVVAERRSCGSCAAPGDRGR